MIYHWYLIVNNTVKNAKINFTMLLFHLINSIFIGVIEIVAIFYFAKSDPKIYFLLLLENYYCFLKF